MHRVFSLATILGLVFCTSCSCYNVRLSTEEAKVGIPIGSTIEARKELIGMLVEHIDDGHKYVVITELPGFGNRYVLKRIPIPAGTRFQVVGFERPRNFLCSGMDAVLYPNKPLESSGSEAQIGLVQTTSGSFALNYEMFREHRDPKEGES